MAQRAGRPIAVVVAGLALTVGLTACGSSSKNSDASTVGQSATTAVTTPAVTAAPPTTQAAPLVKTAASDKFGTILTDANGKSLYTFDRDTSTTSACTGGCATTWPALLLPAGGTTPIPNAGVKGTLGLGANPAGGSQITLNGKPLYRYSGDANPGDTNGDGVGGIWHIATQS
jgi:predicted lipoprotein with Yx(FWY)xxD motif